ncbi:MAG: AAA family ATPase [Planctomycetes bacterium]|nr:AAA family ATPase [Planctomycetota bacterium]
MVRTASRLHWLYVGRRPEDLTPELKSPEIEQALQTGLPIYQGIDSLGQSWIRMALQRPVTPPPDLDWLWPGRIPLGQLTVIEGADGVGKSFVALDLAARATRSEAWPQPLPVVATEQAEKSPEQLARAQPGPGHVLLYSVQDDGWGNNRRLLKLGVDPARLRHQGVCIDFGSYPANGRVETLQFPADLLMLRQDLTDRPEVRCVVIDDLDEFCEGPKQVTAALRELNDMAQEFNVAIIATLPAQVRFDQQGSLRVTSKYGIRPARCVWCVATPPNQPQRRLFVARRTNAFVEPTGLAFQIQEGRVVWDCQSVVQPHDPLGQRSAIQDYLDSALVEGTQPVKLILRMTNELGFTAQQVRLIAQQMGIVSQKRPGFGKDGGWNWVTRTHAEAAARQVNARLMNESESLAKEDAHPAAAERAGVEPVGNSPPPFPATEANPQISESLENPAVSENFAVGAAANSDRGDDQTNASGSHLDEDVSPPASTRSATTSYGSQKQKSLEIPAENANDEGATRDGASTGPMNEQTAAKVTPQPAPAPGKISRITAKQQRKHDRRQRRIERKRQAKQALGSAPGDGTAVSR